MLVVIYSVPIEKARQKTVVCIYNLLHTRWVQYTAVHKAVSVITKLYKKYNTVHIAHAHTHGIALSAHKCNIVNFNG